MMRHCGWCDMGDGKGSCVNGDSSGPFSAIASGDDDKKRLPYDMCGEVPHILNGLNMHWSHSQGGLCPPKAKSLTDVLKSKPPTQNITIGVTLRHFSKDMKPEQEEAIQKSLASVMSIPVNRTHIYISGLEPETKSGTFRIEVLLTVMEVKMEEAPKLVSNLDAAVSHGGLEKELNINGLEMKLANQTVHMTALLSHGTNSASSPAPEEWPLPPLRVELDPLWKVDPLPPPPPEPKNLTTIHALADHPHLSGHDSVRFKLNGMNSLAAEKVERHSTATVAAAASTATMRAFLDDRYQAAMAMPGLEEGQRHLLAENFHRLQECLKHRPVASCIGDSR